MIRSARHLIAASLIILAALPLIAAPAGAEGAILFKNSQCTVLDASGTPVTPNAGSSIVVITQSPNNTTLARCQGQVDPPASGTAVQFSGATSPIPCTLRSDFGEITADHWQETISASGNATIVCHFNEYLQL